jgi:PhoPQ-activated pathogenicity-related protein
VDLNAAYSISNLPPGTVVSWHTATPATDANRMTAAQAMHVTVSGTYYAAINISGANCYSNTIPVNVTIIPCSGSSAITGLELKSAGEMTSGKIMVYPNPFTHSVHVVIQSEKNEKATLVLTDVMGSQLKTLSVQLMHGGNQFSFERLDQFPSGSYFLKVASLGGIQTFKILRQQ